MATPPLLTASDLTGFAGSPFTEDQAKRAGEDIRAEAGWHIAPSVTETVVVDSDGGRYLFLDTLYLTSVTAVRDVTNTSPVVVTDYRVHKTARFRAGILDRPGGWPVGVLELDIVHGYDLCPAPLLQAAAAIARASRGDGASGSVRLGSLSLNLPDSPETVGATVNRFKIPGRP